MKNGIATPAATPSSFAASSSSATPIVATPTVATPTHAALPVLLPTPFVTPKEENQSQMDIDQSSILTAARAITFDVAEQQSMVLQKQQQQQQQQQQQAEVSNAEDPVRSGWDINDQALPPVSLNSSNL